MTHRTQRFYALTADSANDLMSQEELVFGPGMSPTDAQDEVSTPAGIFIAQTRKDCWRPDDKKPHDLVEITLPHNFIERCIDPYAPLSQCAPEAQDNLLRLTEDMPGIELTRLDTLMECEIYLRSQFGSIGASRLCAAAGIDGFWLNNRPLLINPDIIHAAQVEHCLLPKTAKIKIDRGSPPFAPAPLPGSVGEVERDYTFLFEYPDVTAKVRKYQHRQDPSVTVFTKQDKTEFATLERYVGMRMAEAFGVPVPNVCLCLDEARKPVLIAQGIHSQPLRQAKLESGSSVYKNFRWEKAATMALLPWMIMDHRDLHDLNVWMDNQDVPSVVIDAGGSLRANAYGFPKRTSVFGIPGWDEKAASTFLSFRRMPYAVGFSEKYAALCGLAPRLASIQGTLDQAAKDIGTLGLDPAKYPADQFTASALKTDIYDVLHARMGYSLRIANKQKQIHQATLRQKGVLTHG